MTLPVDLDTTSKALWKSAQKALEDQGTWRPHDVTLLELFVRSDAEIRSLRKAMGDTFTSLGSRNQLAAHPLIKPLHEAERHFLDYARELKFTPRSRGDEAGKKPAKGKFDL
jgi:phage terminase small subunit